MRNFKGLRRSAIGSALTFGALLGVATNPIYAQEEAFLEEIVVTASKREQTLQEVPIAVSVTDADTVEKAVILDVLDLQTVVPSLRVTQLQSSANTNFLIRGFGNGANNPGIEPSVGVFIDGVYRSRSASALSDLPNLERVEVLRGPQSTLFGKNASAGVISVVTRAPQFETGGSAEVLVGNFGSTVVRGNITGGLSETVAASFSANYNTRDGYFDNLQDGSEINGRERFGVRGQLLFQPSDTFSARIIADFDEIDENCCGTTNLQDGPTGDAVRAIGGNLVPNDPFSFETFLNFDTSNVIENSGISAQLDWDFDTFSITSITAFRNQTTEANADSDFTGADLIGRNFENRDIDTLSQELRLTTSFGDRADALFGLYYFNEDVAYDTEILYGADFRNYGTALAVATGASPTTFSDLEGALGLPVGTFFAEGAGARETARQDDEAISIFANFDIYLSDRATLTLGANYTQNDKEVSVSQDNTDVFSGLDFVQVGFGGAFGALTGLPPTPENIAANPAAAAQAQAISVTACSAANPPPLCNETLALVPFQFLPPFLNYPNAVEDGISEDTETTYTVRFAYDLTDSLNFYVSYGTGFKSTSWNLSRDARPLITDEAALIAAGITIPNNNPVTRDAAFGTRFAGPEETEVIEAGLKGQFDRGSFAFTIFDQSIEGFQSNVFTGTGFNLVNAGEQSAFGAEFESTWFPTDNLQLNWALTWLDPEYDDFPESSVGDLTGTTPPGIHEISTSISGTYTWDLASGWTAFVRGDYLYEDEVPIVENVPAALASREVSLLNASFGFASPNGWNFGVWGRNLTDDQFLQSAFPTVAQAGSFNGYPNQPRTFGITIRKDFGL
ncbi:MAG: TonB-dependent receptor [Pseudomonadota bacterium]